MTLRPSSANALPENTTPTSDSFTEPTPEFLDALGDWLAVVLEGADGSSDWSSYAHRYTK